MEERYAFTAEWYDPNAALIRRYLLNYYPSDNACEMVDLKSRKLFLKRSPCEHVTLKDLFIGAVVNIHSRQLNITQYGDEFTERKLKSTKEKTLGIIKPDCSAGKVGQIWDRVAREGFLISQARMVQLSQEEAREFYAEHRGKPFFENLVGFMTEGPVVAFEITGEDAVARWRHVLGPTDSSVARQEAPGSLRAQFGTDKTRNACHGSDSQTSAEREITFFFGGAGVGGTGTASAGKPRGRTPAKLVNSTLGIVKPHAVLDGLAGKIIAEITSAGLSVTALQLHHVSKANAEEFLEVYKGVVAEYTGMVEELCSGPCVAMEISAGGGVAGEKGVHATFRELVGPLDPEIARTLRPNTLRAKFGRDKVKNALHCTDLPDDASLEVEYFFRILDS